MTTPTPGEMSCEELVQVITDYLEGALPAADRTRFEKHLGECDGCQNYLEQMRLTVRTLGKVTEESIPSEGRQQLLDAFRAWKQGK